MPRPEPQRESARPTLFTAAPGAAHGPALRMLAPRPLHGGRPPARRAKRRWIAAVGAALLLASGVAARWLTVPTPRSPAPPPAVAAVLRPAARPAPPAAQAAPAVIESIAPADDRVDLAPPAPLPPTAPALRARPAPAPAARQQAAFAKDPAPAPAADADVDLLAAMVARLRAADPCRPGETARPPCPASPEAATVPRADAR